MSIKDIFSRLKSDYVFRRFIWLLVSFGITTIFLVYNLILGIVYRYLWNFSISFYYIVLIILRTIILLCERNWKHQPEEVLLVNRRKLFRLICYILVLLDFAYIVPSVLMINAKRPVSVTMIPAIGIAAYTTYKIVSSIINYKRSKNYKKHLSLYAINIIDLMDDIMSVLTLQNTLIIVFGDTYSMKTLSICTSVLILFAMLVFTIFLIIRSHKRL